MPQRPTLTTTSPASGAGSGSSSNASGWCSAWKVTAFIRSLRADNQHRLDHAAAFAGLDRLVDLLEGKGLDQPLVGEASGQMVLDQLGQESLAVAVAAKDALHRAPPAHEGGLVEGQVVGRVGRADDPDDPLGGKQAPGLLDDRIYPGGVERVAQALGAELAD